MSKTIEWKPWERYNQPQQALPIAEPPCKGCHFFKPVRLYNNHGEMVGVRICHREQMIQDFSCYVSEEDFQKYLKLEAEQAKLMESPPPKE